ncbi:hypothetical protein PMIN03_011306 [Paraphaeosphaeria minitans]
MYAVFQTTITQWAFLYDCTLVALFYCAMKEAGYQAEELYAEYERTRTLLWALFLGHMVFSKTIKLVPHLLRNPGDVRFVPVSILFGYLHNLIKLYGCITVTETTWGTREGADTDDNIRMLPIPPMASITPPLSPLPHGRMLRERASLLPSCGS